MITGTLTDQATGQVFQVALTVTDLVVNVNYLELGLGIILGAIIGLVWWTIAKGADR